MILATATLSPIINCMGSHTIRDPKEAHGDTRRVLDAIRRIVRILRLSAAEAERQVGLSAAQLFVLQKLGSGQGISVNELAERTHTHQSSVSVVVQRLVEKKLVRRRRSAIDGRRAEVSITAAGMSKLQNAPAAAQNILIDALHRMSRTNQKHLAKLLEQLTTGAGASKEPPSLFFEDEQTEGRRKRNGR